MQLLDYVKFGGVGGGESFYIFIRWKLAEGGRGVSNRYLITTGSWESISFFLGEGGLEGFDHQCTPYASISSQKTDPISLDHQVEEVRVTFLAKRGGESGKLG